MQGVKYETREPPSTSPNILLLLFIFPKFLHNYNTYWVGQKVHLGFSVQSNGKTQMNFLTNPIQYVYVRVLLTRVWLFATPWTVAHQAPLSMEFSW